MIATTCIEQMPSTNEQVDMFAQQVKQEILSGFYDYRQFLYQKVFIEKTLNTIYEDLEIKEYMQKEIEKHGKEGVGFNDVKYTIEGRKTWDYSQTGDSELADLLAQEKELKEKIKERQKILQVAKKPFANVETGEIIHPAFYTEKSYIKTTKNK